MERGDNLDDFGRFYSEVRTQLDELLDDVVYGWEGDPDPDGSRGEALANTICVLVEREASRQQLSEAGMRGFVGDLRSTFQDMVNAQKQKRPGQSISYENVIRRISLRKPAKEKGPGPQKRLRLFPGHGRETDTKSGSGQGG
ncbi:uncharacterized protein MAM_04914 [Metarhizium album ARSEF 1941]|uniref:Uncharacterized protein n=1 Tax=Metarhizium album (strain ARSEF 1941) TaxID=1081103 RepID=A0A0B2WV47_METAS|nr:uncharacterized protein MAM_04914 [Metarhizium album ARSEF 1941]KHN97317.1 hypothetical protein MAM_04914 [Metarhizium album ARSEF 1941]